MFASMRKRMFTPAGVVAIIALIFAMAGAAWAAGGLTKSQEKQVTKIAKKYAGKPGATGAQGPQGNPGAAGGAGKEGPQGKQGEPGAAGASVTNTKVTAGGSNCEGRGGAEFKVGTEAATFACNGKEGEQGEPGPPGPIPETLPKGRTVSGQWSFVVGPPIEIEPGEEASLGTISFSFPFPLASGPLFTYVETVGEHEAECGTAEAPEPEEGLICFYIGFHLGSIGSPATTGAPTKTGATPLFAGGEPGAFASGSWAVTGN